MRAREEKSVRDWEKAQREWERAERVGREKREKEEIKRKKAELKWVILSLPIPSIGLGIVLMPILASSPFVI